MSIPSIKAPLVLVHGFFGFDRFTVGGLPIAEYFPGIPNMLETARNRVLIPRLSPTRGVAERAEELKKYIDQHAPGQQVHLLAHSMGGLDSRFMISKIGMADRVLTLTTMGTPHRGTPFMDWGIRNLERLVKPMLEMFCVPTQGFYDLTTAGCCSFNDLVPNMPGVRYFSVAGDYQGTPFRPEWVLPHGIVFTAEGANDGVVSVKSATWGEVIAVMDCDHVELAGWNNGLLLPAGPVSDKGSELFTRVLQRLADEGF